MRSWALSIFVVLACGAPLLGLERPAEPVKELDSAKAPDGSQDSVESTKATESTPAKNRTKSPTLNIPRAHALSLGATIQSGDGVLHEQESSPLEQIRATDSSMSLILGGIYRASARHILRYEMYVGFSRIAFTQRNTHQAFFDLNGLKSGVGLGYEWVFYRSNAISWNTFLGAEYSATYYKRDRASMLIQEIMPKLGIGFEGRYHHYFELFFGMPVFSHSSLANLPPATSISKQPRHLRFGFLYMYRF